MGFSSSAFSSSTIMTTTSSVSSSPGNELLYRELMGMIHRQGQRITELKSKSSVLQLATAPLLLKSETEQISERIEDRKQKVQEIKKRSSNRGKSCCMEKASCSANESDDQFSIDEPESWPSMFTCSSNNLKQIPQDMAEVAVGGGIFATLPSIALIMLGLAVSGCNCGEICCACTCASAMGSPLALGSGVCGCVTCIALKVAPYVAAKHCTVPSLVAAQKSDLQRLSLLAGAPASSSAQLSSQFASTTLSALSGEETSNTVVSTAQYDDLHVGVLSSTSTTNSVNVELSIPPRILS